MAIIGFTALDDVPTFRGGLSGSFASGELLVQFAPGTSAAVWGRAIAAVNGRVAEWVSGPGLAGAAGNADIPMVARISLGRGVSVDQAIDILSHRPGVDFAEPNWVVSASAVANESSYTNNGLWGMYGDLTTPANRFGSQAGEAWADGAIGSMKTVVGVIDSGVDYTHPDLYQNIWLNPNEIPEALRASLVDADGDGLITFRDLNDARNSASVSDLNANGRIDAGDLLRDTRWEDGVDGDSNGYLDDLIGWDFVNNDNDPYDDNNHGTHVAGTIGAVGGNGVGVAGVTWATQIVALKFLAASGSGYTSNAVKAVDYFTTASTKSAQLDFVATNNSWGGGGSSTAMLDAIVRGGAADILFVAAAGNSTSNNDVTASFPSNYSTTSRLGFDAVIAVASITSSGAISSFSSYGATTVDLGAPGSSIYSTVPGGYATFSGTSMATPHVTGALALRAALDGADAAELRADLLASTIQTTSLYGITWTGGRLDVAGFLALSDGVSPPPPPPPPPPSGPSEIYGTTASDVIVGTAGADKISGLPLNSTSFGRGTVDKLTGNGGADLFVIGVPQGRFYDDGSAKNAGTGDYALVTDFGADDMLQLASGTYNYKSAKVGGATGLGVYHDTNGNGIYDSRDELVALLQGVSSISQSQLSFV